ncbi:MAG TPA: RdgB/HAM1 family non-canonical purine NTP pyrophosphatase [Gemmatimonadaceae bacterium]|nr:RdgB/HAM1 family non-canonical purine NTP pyrophosphatase [Gemmatimonadaceae bacterium]
MRDDAIVLATRSPGKLRELRALFGAAGLRVVDLAEAGVAEAPAEDAVEAFGSFEENAGAKARYFHERTGGRPVVADDSGLSVAALGGRPGVRSKRWSERNDLTGTALDDANNAKLLEALRGSGDRRARYVCAAVYVDGERTLCCRGEVAGEILEEPRGAGGFGYDPLFWSPELGETFGEATQERKARVSHRGRAFGALLRELSELREVSEPG